MNASSGRDLTLTMGSPNSRVVTGGNSTFTGALNIVTSRLVNTNTLIANSISVTNQLTAGSLIIDGGAGGSFGTLANPVSGGISWTSVAGGISLVGTMDMWGPVTIETKVAGEDVFANAPTHFTGHNQVLVLTDTLFNAGPGLTGNPLLLNVGSLVNQTGDLHLTQNIIFLGRDVALIAAGSIIADVGVTSINLSSTTGDGGHLTMIAGYDFDANPTIGPGSQFTTSTLDNFTLGTGNGSISLGNITIVTNSSVGHGGSVVAVAGRGTINIGSINTGSTDNSGTKFGGEVRLIARDGGYRRHR